MGFYKENGALIGGWQYVQKLRDLYGMLKKKNELIKKEEKRVAMPAAGSRRYQTGKHLEAFILLFIYRRPLHGGAILKHLQDTLPPEWIVDSGGVYRLLRELEATEIVCSTWHTEDMGAPKRYYQLTPQGILRLQEWVQDIKMRRESLTLFLEKWDACHVLHE
ncbi:MAG: PadR family transcriptional regulator [Sulfobacillus thermotolerans]|nr:PadR family transcriptional regulator [Sulfobacillus thermotolerans]